MDKSTNGEAQAGETERPQESGAVSPGRGGRMSRQRGCCVVVGVRHVVQMDQAGRLTLWRHTAGTGDFVAGRVGPPAGVRHMLTDQIWRVEESRRLIEQSLTILAIGRLQVAESRARIAESSQVCAAVAPRIIVQSTPDPLLTNSARK
jgi:hypothetical protein